MFDGMVFLLTAEGLSATERPHPALATLQGLQFNGGQIIDEIHVHVHVQSKVLCSTSAAFGIRSFMQGTFIIDNFSPSPHPRFHIILFHIITLQQASGHPSILTIISAIHFSKCNGNRSARCSKAPSTAAGHTVSSWADHRR